MTPEERQQVIDALELKVMWADALAPQEREMFAGALAIMRREREETTVPHVHEWLSTGTMEPGQIRCISCGAWGRER